MMNRLVAASVLALLLIGTLPLSGCSGEVSFTTASLSEVTMCLGVDAESKPVNPTDTFTVITPEIFCSVKLSNAPDETEVLSEWVYVKGELADVTDYVIDSIAITTDGTRYLQFSMEIPDDGWPVGDYTLNLYIDGKDEVSVPFTVIATATLSEATMALGVDALSRPLNPASTFPPSTPEIFCSVLVSDAPAGTEVAAEWVYVSGELQGVSNMVIDSFALQVEGTDYVQFSLPIAADTWPTGQYLLNLYVDGTLQAQLPFAVSLASISAVMAMTIDADRQPVNPTTVFPIGVERVWTVVFVNEAPPGAKIQVEWYEVGGAVDTFLNEYEADLRASDSPLGLYSTQGTGGWPAGEYAVVVSVNGERQLVLPFTVA
jgi:hypothetical protein